MEGFNMEEMINIVMEPVAPVLDLDHMDLNLHIACQNPRKVPKSEVIIDQNPSSVATSYSSSLPQIISFSNPSDIDAKVTVTQREIQRKTDPNSLTTFQNMNISFIGDEEGEDHHGHKQPRSPKHAQFHALAERNRRNKLREHFISLSRVVPGIRKLDKSTILEDATNHIKDLEERITRLEKETKVNASGIHSRNDPTCVVNNKAAVEVEVEGEMPEIKVIFLIERNVLIKILCNKKYQGSILLMSEELRKLHLVISSTNVLQFGDCAIDITFGAQMETQFSATVEDIISHLQDAIFQVK